MTADSKQFAIIPLHEHQRPPDAAIAVGSLDAVMERIVDSEARADAAQLLVDAAVALGQIERQKQQEQQLIARGMQTLNDSIAALTKRMDALEARRTERAQQAADAEAQRIQEKLDRLPDPDDPRAPGDDTHQPGGELHALQPSEEHDREQLAAGDSVRQADRRVFHP
jgi:hypothetical protein